MKQKPTSLGDGAAGKCWPCKHEDLVSISRTYVKELGLVAHALCGGGASLCYLASSRPVRNHVSKTKGGDA